MKIYFKICLGLNQMVKILKTLVLVYQKTKNLFNFIFTLLLSIILLGLTVLESTSNNGKTPSQILVQQNLLEQQS